MGNTVYKEVANGNELIDMRLQQMNAFKDDFQLK